MPRVARRPGDNGRRGGAPDGGGRDGAPRGGAGRDNLREVESLTTKSSRFSAEDEVSVAFGRGADVLVGNGRTNFLEGGRGPDLLRGGDGRDRLRGGDGRDRLRGGDGRDRLFTADGRRDLVSCGSGRDRATVDRLDRVQGCERIRVRRRLTTIPDR